MKFWQQKTRSTCGVASAATAAMLIASVVFLSPRLASAVGEPENGAEALVAGESALQDGLYEAAERQFQLHVEKLGGIGKVDDDMVVLILRSLHPQKKYAEMLSLLKVRLRDTGEKREPAAFMYWRALALYETGKPEEALAEISDFEKKPADAEYAGRVCRLRAWCFINLGKPELAIEEFARFDKTWPGSTEAQANLLELGKILLNAGRVGEAGEALSRLAAAQPESAFTREASYWLGEALAREQKLDEAEAMYLRLGTNDNVGDPLRTQAAFALAGIFESRSNTTDAVAMLSNAVMQTKSPALKQLGLYSMGKIYLDAGRLDEAVPLLKAFIAEAPAEPNAERAQIALADKLLEKGRNAEAVAEYQHYLETFTNQTGQAEAHFGRGWGLLKIDRHAEAATEFEKAHAGFIDPVRKEESLFKAGDAYFANGQFKLAAAIYEKFVSAFPQSILLQRAFFQMAESLSRGEDQQMAENKFREFVAKYPSGPLAEEASLRLGEMCRSRKMWNEAVQYFDGVIATGSNKTFVCQARHGRGMVQYSLFRFADARADFEKVVGCGIEDPATEQAFFMRGLCDYGMAKDEQALAICREFLVKYPASRWAADVMFWIGKYEYNQANYEVAEKQFVQIVDTFKESPLADMALLFAGQSALKRKEYVRSKELFNRMVKEYPQSRRIAEGRMTQAESLRELADYPAAILIYEEIISKYADSDFAPSAWIGKADCQFTQNRFKEAMESYLVVASSASAPADAVIQAKFKVGKCHEKLDRKTEAFDQYYAKILVPFKEEREKGVWHTEGSKLWFTRAAVSAADIMESRKEWSGAVSILERIVEADVPAAADVKERIKKIRSEHWMSFLNGSS